MIKKSSPDTCNKGQTAMMPCKRQYRTETECREGHKHKQCLARSNLKKCGNSKLMTGYKGISNYNAYTEFTTMCFNLEC